MTPVRPTVGQPGFLYEGPERRRTARDDHEQPWTDEQRLYTLSRRDDPMTRYAVLLTDGRVVELSAYNAAGAADRAYRVIGVEATQVRTMAEHIAAERAQFQADMDAEGFIVIGLV